MSASVEAEDTGSVQNKTSEDVNIADRAKATSSNCVSMGEKAAGSSKPSCSIPWKIHNVVSTVNLDTPLDLTRIALRTRNSEYRPKRFPGLVMRLGSPSSTTLVFGNGKLVVSGCRSPEESNLSARKVARIIQKLGYEVRFKNFRIINMVALIDVRFPINLDELNNSHCQFCNYEPEIFPALFYHLLKPRVTVLVFVSGKIIVTGAKDVQDLGETLDNMYPILANFRKPSSK